MAILAAIIVQCHVCTHYSQQHGVAASRNQPEPWVGVAMLTSPHLPYTVGEQVKVGVAMLKSSHHHTADRPVDMATLTS